MYLNIVYLEIIIFIMENFQKSKSVNFYRLKLTNYPTFINLKKVNFIYEYLQNYIKIFTFKI